MILIMQNLCENRRPSAVRARGGCLSGLVLMGTSKELRVRGECARMRIMSKQRSGEKRRKREGRSSESRVLPRD